MWGRVHAQAITFSRHAHLVVSPSSGSCCPVRGAPKRPLHKRHRLRRACSTGRVQPAAPSGTLEQLCCSSSGAHPYRSLTSLCASGHHVRLIEGRPLQVSTGRSQCGRSGDWGPARRHEDRWQWAAAARISNTQLESVEFFRSARAQRRPAAWRRVI